MYLTRFPVNTARSEARRLLGSPHRMHGAVNMAFPRPPARDGENPRVLWRLDQAPGDRLDLLVSSPDRPDFAHLAEQAGWPSLGREGWTTFAYAEFLDALAEGDTWAFRLTANPVHHIRRAQDPVGAPTKRTAHLTVRHQIQWLLKQQERAGFTVLRRSDPPLAQMPSPVADAPPPEAAEEWGYQVTVHDRAPVQFGRPTRDSSRPAAAPGADVRFARATFDGRLRITGMAAFRRALTHGLGKSKAYGCGLMTLAPVR
ncbi:MULTISPECIES: type I-E CRISPR-associated protein Cas6/Cse3/CasE [unclassified Streptomyces]|uniref:type I-E CRISPR-associated protein Cas6/Cse3/CasE n=1 Tax=unclassified Streptomyces TaxID=2593676 RepID=UPI0016609A94|nr:MULTISPECIES: type I-E CRISPR-associated protein Cas6/Cse3/CasE [unclassified Streptomyces]MBD0708221.1 type I-E CRISPR-associated protein Cas6/Cse3/CasE [Streptomyces sp. CBMA291]MBD0717790.1 type I-E CRISPR-associated protein Cas6/Cse3/CasE [Streptomyces sp. CBMA370]